jgi:hypothetical protein
MKSKVLWALVALNVLLLVGLIVPLGRTNVARAQANGRPSEYLMIPGEVIGGNSAVIYIVDEEKQALSAVALDPKGNSLDSMQPIDLRRAFEGR